jgi:hypothetical protein
LVQGRGRGHERGVLREEGEEGEEGGGGRERGGREGAEERTILGIGILCKTIFEQ